MIDVHLNRADEWKAVAGLEDSLLQAVRLALDSSTHPPEGEISITFVTDDEMRDLNRTYLNRDHSTDVIAFELGEPGRLLGDVYISPEVALRSAATEQSPPSSEFVRLVVHGTLHLLGHDHPDGSERWASPMFELQERLVRRITGEDAEATANGNE